MQHETNIANMVRRRRSASLRATLAKKKVITVTLYRIASTSPKHDVVVNQRDEWLGTAFRRSKEHNWSSAEAEFLWAIYERAVYDHHGIKPGKSEYDGGHYPADETATTGNIRLSSGKVVNILELLGIDPEWSRSQLGKAINHTQKMAA